MTADNAFEQFARTVDSPMMIVTARAGDAMDGCLVSFSTQCSIDPTHYLVCLSKANRTFLIASEAQCLVVHVLHDTSGDRELARLFGEETADDVDKLSRCDWERGLGGAPLLVGCDWFAGEILTRVDLGDHVGFALEVGTGSVTRADEPLLGFQAVRDFHAGKPA